MNDITQASLEKSEASDLPRRGMRPFRALLNSCLSLAKTLGQQLLRMVPSVEDLRKLALNILIVLGIILGVGVIMKASFKSYVTIDPINVPKGLVDRGITGEVVSQRIHDELAEIGRTSKIKQPLGEFSTLSFERSLPKIDLPVGGMSLATVVTSLREFLGLIDTRIGGEIVIDDDDDPKKKYSMRLRITDRGAVYQSEEPTHDLGGLFRLAALRVVERFDPHIAAAYHYAKKNYDEALRMIHFSLSDSSIGNDAIALNLRGLIAKHQKRYGDALTQFRDVRARFPTFVAAQHNIAATLIMKGAYAEALNEANIGIAIDPNGVQGHTNAGSALYSMHRFNEALSHFEKSAAIAPTEVTGYLNQASVYRIRSNPNYEKAVALYRRAADADPHDPRTFIAWGSLARERGNHREARLLFERAIDAKPGSPGGYERLGALLLEEQKLERAEKLFRKALTLDADSERLHWYLGRALQDGGNYEGAIAEYRRAIEIDDKFARAYIKLATALAQNAQQAKVEAPSEPVKSDDQKTVQASDDVMAEINELLEQAKGMGAKDARILQELGKAYEILGRNEAAIESYRAAVAVDSDRNAGLNADIERLGRRLISN